MNLFPSISAVAKTPIEKIIKVWEGLGYYARARHIHAGAIYLTEHHGGELPASYEELKRVKGLGPYTIGAILSFAFKQKWAAADGNIFRLLARYFEIEEPIDKSRTQSLLRSLCTALLPEKKPWIAMEALIELGALVCQKRAQCHLCPLEKSCLGKKRADFLPVKEKKSTVTILHRTVAVIQSKERFLMRKGKRGEVMEGLLEFPYFDRGVNVEKILGLPLNGGLSLPTVTHTFTRYKAILYPRLYQAVEQSVKGYTWLFLEELKESAFSSGHRRIFESLFTTD